MKKYVCIVFLCFSVFARGQSQLTGTYTKSSDIGHTMYKFSGNNSFEYEATTCIKAWSGWGTYRVNGERLSLFFSKADSAKNSHFVIRQIPCDKPCSISVVACDLKHDTIPFLNVRVEDGSHTRKNFITDKQGKTIFDVQDFEFPLSITALYSGSTHLTAKIKNKECASVSFYMNIYGPEIINGRKESWKIQKMDSTELVLKADKVLRLTRIK